MKLPTKISFPLKYLHFFIAFYIIALCVCAFINFPFGKSNFISGSVLLLVPTYLGYTLKRLTNLKQIFYSRFLECFLYGFIILILIALFSLLIKAQITYLLIAIGVILVFSIISNFFIKPFKYNSKITIQIANKYELFKIIIILSISTIILLLGSNIIGDVSAFHIPLASKVNGILDASQMTITIRESAYPGYNFPVWHVLIGVLSQTLHTPVVFIWLGLSWPLVIFTVLAWEELINIFMPQKNNTAKIIALTIIVVVLSFKDVTYFYLLGLLPSPCVLCDYLLMPINLFLIIKYFINGRFSLLFISITVYSVMLLIHNPHFLYLPIQVIILSLGLMLISLFIKTNIRFKHLIIPLTIYAIFLLLFIAIGVYYSHMNNLSNCTSPFRFLIFSRTIPILLFIPVSLILIKKREIKYILPVAAFFLLLQCFIFIPPNTIPGILCIPIRRIISTTMIFSILPIPLLAAWLYATTTNKLRLNNIILIIIIIFISGYLTYHSLYYKLNFLKKYRYFNIEQYYSIVDKDMLEYIKNIDKQVFISDIEQMQRITENSTNYIIYYKGEYTQKMRESILDDIDNFNSETNDINNLITICQKYYARYALIKQTSISNALMSKHPDKFIPVYSSQNNVLYQIVN